jgi:hypothetical protein
VLSPRRRLHTETSPDDGTLDEQHLPPWAPPC